MLNLARYLFSISILAVMSWVVAMAVVEGVPSAPAVNFILVVMAIGALSLLGGFLCLVLRRDLSPRNGDRAAVEGVRALSFWQKFRFSLAEKIAQKIVGRDFVLRITPVDTYPEGVGSMGTLGHTRMPGVISSTGGGAGGDGGNALVAGGTGVRGGAGDGAGSRQGSVLVEYLLLCGASMTATWVAMQTLAQVQAEWLEQLRQMIQGMAP